MNLSLVYTLGKQTCRLNSQINMVDLIKCQIRMTNLTNCNSQWLLYMVNLTKPWSS
jgi:hypothetical protein